MIHELIPRSSTVFTPPDLAAAMVRAAVDFDGCEWLDPCVGDGAFVAALSALGVPRQRVRALDISYDRGERDQFARTERGVDFIDWATHNSSTVDRVVMNPPYVALSRLRGEPLERALQVTLSNGKSLPFKANYWCAFLLRAVECLKPGGALVAVLPASWEFARYARPVRDSVARDFGYLSVIRCMTPLFPTVKEGSIVIVARGRGESIATASRIEVSNLDGATSALGDIATGKVPTGAMYVRNVSPSANSGARLSEIVDIRIGAVTGDAKYFLLTEEERLRYSLPRSAVKPVLSRRKHLTHAVVDEKVWACLRDQGGRVWLFRPNRAALRHPAVDAYLTTGKNGSCKTNGLKVRSREPWHRTPLPERVDGFLSGMSKRLPFLVLRGMNGLSATNTLYVVSFKDSPRTIDRATLGIVLLTSGVRRELARHARVYAEGLLKFEPTELGNIRIPIVKARSDALTVFKTATAFLLAGKSAEAEELADAWVAGDLEGEEA